MCDIPGIFFTEGPLWHEQRRYALRYLRDFGFGRRQDELELELHDETLNLIDLIKNGPKYEFEKVCASFKFTTFLTIRCYSFFHFISFYFIQINILFRATTMEIVF